MPDFAGRSDRENELAAAMLLLFQEQEARVRREGVSYALLLHFERETTERLQPILEETFLQAGATITTDDAVLAALLSSAETWAAANAQQLATLVTAKTAESLNSAAADVQADTVDFDDALDAVFSDARAENIAITETTRATTAGMDKAATIAIGLGILADGLARDPIWITANDGRVCPICEPLNNTPQSFWVAYVLSGPPAHPRCRCYLEYPTG